MQENIFVRTVGLDSNNLVKIAKDLKNWLWYADVYVQNDPIRIVVICKEYCTVINEGDVFSFMQNTKIGMKYVINHSEKQETVKVKISTYDFIIETFVYETVGTTENRKFKLICLTDPDLSGEFDDYEALKERLNEFLWEAVDGRLLV